MASKAKPFLVCFEAHSPDDKVWSVRFGRTWYRTRTVVFNGGPVRSVYLGARARQPRAYFKGEGWMLQDTNTITLWPA